MKEITTKSGCTLSIDTDNLDDMELLDALAELNENPLLLSKVAIMMIGEENKRRLYEDLRTEKGNIPVQAFNDALMEIMELAGAKN